MNENEQQLREIEQGEVWLSDVMAGYPEPSPRGIENLKLTVRIATEERTIESMATPPPSRETLDGVKRAVRAELDSETVARPWSGVRWSQVAGGLAAAAALAFWFVPIHVTSSELPVSETELAMDDFVAVFADSGGDDEMQAWSDQVETIESEVRFVADLLVSDDSGWDDYRLNDLDAIDQQIEDLFQEIEDATET